jgi:septum formation protein
MTGPGSIADASEASLPELILASTSVYRRVLLERLDLPFRVVAPSCDESILQRVVSDPAQLAGRLADAKASSVVSVAPRAAIIGCDQLVSCDGRVLGKSGTAAGATDQLTFLSGRSHALITALVVLCGAQRFHHTDVTTLRMRPLSRRAIERYVAADRPIDCAGSYKLESRGITLFEQIDSNDHTAITGLPLISLVSILRELGFEIP